MTKSIIQIKQLQLGYRVGAFRLAVESLCVAAQERVALIGPSGCGKTTLLNLLAGILAPAQGQIDVDGTCISGLNQEDRQDFRALHMGLVFQEFELLEYLTVFDNVLLPFRLNPILQLNREVQDRARMLCDKVGLGDKSKRYPALLSQGERQRVAVCRALVTQPKVIFGDEPTGNLDPSNRDLVMDILSDYSESSKAPLVIVTHDHELLGRFDRSVDLCEGSGFGIKGSGFRVQGSVAGEQEGGP
jgi:putative ABC transport system ATP-binding protein